MNKILPESDMQRQMQAYALAVLLLLGAVFFPDWLARVAGVCFAVANAWLFFNLLSAIRRYRHHMVEITKKLAVP